MGRTASRCSFTYGMAVMASWPSAVTTTTAPPPSTSTSPVVPIRRRTSAFAAIWRPNITAPAAAPTTSVYWITGTALPVSSGTSTRMPT